MFKNKKVLVTGSEGMIGKELVILLEELNVETHCIDLKHEWDLTYKDEIDEIFEENTFDYIFHLAGVKGSPKMTNERPVDFMGPMLQFDTNMILAAQKYKVKRFLYTSSIAVENPESDKYPAWAKQTAEKLIDAMRIQYPEVVIGPMQSHATKYCIVRPANVYGRFDNFERKDNMVITSLINKALKDKKLIMDRKGSKQIRDFINAKDVARGMIKAMEEMPEEPVNLCSGKGQSIGRVADIIRKHLNIPITYKNLHLTLGPDKKTMKNPYIKTKIKLDDGIIEVIDVNQ